MAIETGFLFAAAKAAPGWTVQGRLQREVLRRLIAGDRGRETQGVQWRLRFMERNAFRLRRIRFVVCGLLVVLVVALAFCPAPWQALVVCGCLVGVAISLFRLDAFLLAMEMGAVRAGYPARPGAPKPIGFKGAPGN